MKKSTLVFLAILFALPMTASAQTYHRPYYEQRHLLEAKKRPYFLENRTDSPLKVVLLVRFPSGVEQKWLFEIDQDSEVYAMLPFGFAFGFVTARIDSAVVSVSQDNKIISKKVKSRVYDREDEDGLVLRGWLFYR